MKLPDNISKFLKIFRCLNCRTGKINLDGDVVVCENCAHQYPVEQGIPKLLPAQPMRLPRIYDDKDYQIWINNMDQDYFYKTKGVSYVQNSGHIAIKKLKGSKKYNFVLDLGCGDGAHYPYMNCKDGFFGIDIDFNSLAKLKSRHPDFFVICADGYELPLRDKTVDCIVNLYNLEHMVYPDLAMEEMQRILTPAGDIYISVPHVGGFVSDLGSKLTSQRDLTTDTFNYRRALEISHINCIWQLDKAVKRYFKVKRISRFPFYIPSFQFNLVTTYHCVNK